MTRIDHYILYVCIRSSSAPYPINIYKHLVSTKKKMIFGESADKTLHNRTLTHLDSEVFLGMSDKNTYVHTQK